MSRDGVYFYRVLPNEIYKCISGEPIAAITKRIFASDRKLNSLMLYRFYF